MGLIFKILQSRLMEYENKYNKLKVEFDCFKALNCDIYENVINVIDNYYLWLSENDLNANDACVYVEYKKYLKTLYK